jgi:hypothetical protein
VEMKYERKTIRYPIDVPVGYNESLYNMVVKRKWNPLTGTPLKDVAELFRVTREVVNGDESRIAAVRILLEKHPRLIVFYNFDYELMKLRSLITDSGLSQSEPSRVSGKPSTNLVLAEWNGHKHEPIPTSERWVYLVQYAAGAEGWNCTSTDAMCFYSLTYSYKMWHQAHGRIDRLNTGHIGLHYYTLISDSSIDSAIRQALAEKRNFNESTFDWKTNLGGSRAKRTIPTSNPSKTS